MVNRNSAMSKQQKFCILANELTRRLLNTDIEKEEEEVEREVTKVIEHYTSQLKNSEWGMKEVREIVVSGFAGWIRKRRRREENGEELYRSAAASLPARVRGKLTGKESWYRNKKRRKPDEFDNNWRENQPMKKRKAEEDQALRHLTMPAHRRTDKAEQPKHRPLAQIRLSESCLRQAIR